MAMHGTSTAPPTGARAEAEWGHKIADRLSDYIVALWPKQGVHFGASNETVTPFATNRKLAISATST